MSIGFLEPLNAQMTTGALLAEYLDGTETPAEGIGKFAKSSFEGTAQSLLDLPAMSSLQDLVNGYSYSSAETTGGKVLDALTSYAASQVSSFVPNIVRSIARASDPYVRDVYSSGTIGGEAVDSIKNSLPVLRNTLPIRQTPFGEDRTYGDNQVMNALNAVILPGAITQYRTSDAAQELYSLPVVEDIPVYPRRNAPNSVSSEGTTYDLTYEQKTQYQGDSVARQKQTALSQYLDGLGLTDAQRTVVDDTYKFYNMFPADPIPYSIETMSDAAQARWPAAQAEGMSEEEFLKYYPIRAQSGTGITKEVKLRQLQEAGMTYQEANDFWNLTK